MENPISFPSPAASLPLALQGSGAAPREGVPYWTFWLLLCVILLLMAFIFLRDKDLRQRLSFRLSGATRRMKRTQLQIRIRRAKRKRAERLRELGRKAAAERIRLPKAAPLLEDIEGWETRGEELRGRLKQKAADLQRLRKRVEENRGPSKFRRKPEAGGRPAGAADKELDRRLRREIKEAEKAISTVQADLDHVGAETALRLERLGVLVDGERPAAAGFADLYAEIDALNRSLLRWIGELDELT